MADLLGQPLYARAAGHQRIDGLAIRAKVRAALHMAAMVTGERLAEAVLDQPGAAVRALKAMAAAPAQRQRRVAAPVQEQQGLFAPRKRLGERGAEARRNPFAARRGGKAHVDRLDDGHRTALKAPVELEMKIAPLIGVDAALDRGRRRGENDRGAL